MPSSIVALHEYTSVSLWRTEDQLRGLIKSHPQIVATSGLLASKGTLFSCSQLALHNTEAAMAVALCPTGGSASQLGMLELSGDDSSLASAANMRWMEVGVDGPVSSVDWCNSLLALGSSRGRVFVCEKAPKSVSEPSGILEPQGCLVTSNVEKAVGDITVTPSSHAATTLVRSLRFNTQVDPMSLIGVRGTAAFMWDLNAGPEPHRVWSLRNSLEVPVIMFTAWAPGTRNVVLCGAYDGTLALVDTRTPDHLQQGLVLTMPHGYRVRSGDFSTVMPFCVAAASSNGTIHVFDCRFASRAMRVLSTLQGDVSCVKWDKHHADLLATAGTDGTVGMWCLRSAPTFCVGRAQYRMPVSSIVTTRTFSRPRIFGLTCEGELSMTGLSDEALVSLAPLPTAASSKELWHQRLGAGATAMGTRSPRGMGTAECGPSSPASMILARGGAAGWREATTMGEDVQQRMLANERQCMGFLYMRNLRKAYSALADCAAERLSWTDTASAAKLVSLIDVVKTPSFDYDRNLEARAESDIAALIPFHQAVEAFETQLLLCSERLCTTVPISAIRDFVRPSPDDIKRLEALRINVQMRRLLDSNDADFIVKGSHQQLDQLALNVATFDLVDHDVLCGLALFLLRVRFLEGRRFLSRLAQILIRDDGTCLSRPLVKQLMLAVQQPLLTAGASARVARNFDEAFFNNLKEARRAISTQLEVVSLGIENSERVVGIMTEYQAQCTEQSQVGIFGWLSVKPILLFMHCLAAQSKYTVFFWMSVQLIDAFARFPSVKQIESVLFETVDRIQNAGTKIRDELDSLSELKRFGVPQLRQVEAALRTSHSFLTVLLRVELECENVTIDSNLSGTPVVMARILEVMDTVSTSILQSWAALMDALMDCPQKGSIGPTCLPIIREFSHGVEDLIEVSHEKSQDETLNSILDICDEFIDIFDA